MNRPEQTVGLLLGVAAVAAAGYLLLRPRRSGRPAPCGPIGDPDGNGMITNFDAQVILAWTQVPPESLSDDQTMRGDVNGNGVVDLGDVQMVIDYINGVRDSFPACSLP